ncbi:MAG: iron-containing alcohol dehydrogenase [Clostridia bacterium]|nr:iron-containing alcohol dehydrogenase [Clostridia bacterium]
MDFDLNIPVRVRSGKGVVMANAAAVAAIGKRCLIVTGGSSAKKSGALADVTAMLNSVGVTYDVFSDVGPNPLLSACHRAGALARDFGADFLFGIGGGSALDAAKAAAVYAANPDFAPRDIYTKQRKPALPLVLVGTTAGTGSEVGRVSVLTDDATGRKKSVSGDDLYPVFTLADPTYTHSMPRGITVSTALDALSHAMEGYFTPKCGDIPSLFAEKAVALLWAELVRLSETGGLPDDDAREKLYYGSLYAGITLAYCGTAFPHPLGYVLTENFGTPHGMACAAFLPAFLRRAMQHRPDRAARLLDCMGTTAADFDRIVTALTDVAGITMTDGDIARFCARWDESVPNNFRSTPGGYGKEDAAKLFKEKFGV